ncbi:MAG TPA: RES family NAD+ phosphorylase [Thermomicrobiales bacterium]|nr:RES family NAD+ phosphorylase [Thermomicrobiales bacterium]
MAIRLAPTPAVLFRIGRSPDPLAFPPLAFSGAGRYDDPQKRTSVLYAAVDRRAAFMETLDAFRPDLATLADRNAAVGPGADEPDVRSYTPIPTKFFNRRIARFSVAANQRWLDVRSPETHEVLREELGAFVSSFSGVSRFVLGDLLSNDHRVTQLVAGWAIGQGFHGIAYASCHDPSLTCWAIFEDASLTPLEDPRPVQIDDVDLAAVAKLWSLEIPFA